MIRWCGIYTSTHPIPKNCAHTMATRFSMTQRRSKPSRSFRIETLERRALLAANTIGAVVPDFQLVDVNPNSSGYTSNFSPRDLVGQTGAFYFVRST